MHLIAIVVCLARIVLAMPGHNYTVIDKHVTWNKAANVCDSEGFQLASKSNVGTRLEVDEATRQAIPLNMKVWIDQAVKYTPWLSYKGCYKHTSEFAVDNKNNLTDNRRTTCSKECQYFTFFAMKGSVCWCLNDLKTFQGVPPLVCNSTCPDEEMQLCSGNDVYTIHEIKKNIKVQQDTNSYLCLTYARKMKDEKFHETWKSERCLTKHNYICKTENGSYINSTYVKSWYDARIDCIEKYGHLVSDEEKEGRLNPIMNYGEQYWIGTFRKFSVTSKHDESETHKNVKCLTVVQILDGWINIEEEDCSKKYQPLCQKEIPVAAKNATVTSNRNSDEPVDVALASNSNHDKHRVNVIILGVLCGIFVLALCLSTYQNIILRRRFTMVRNSDQYTCDCMHPNQPNSVQIVGDQNSKEGGLPVVKRTDCKSVESNLGKNNEEIYTYQTINSSLLIDMLAITPTPEQAATSDSEYYDHLSHVEN